ncbi:hypothetical protein ABZV60_32710 [Streptomyces sp. NPDC004787]|uniref:hypothetical protein n=1 Tax=Streptomyces sp. NPDC004787 TaxID=3154291 RepID=UPI0033BC1B4A
MPDTEGMGIVVQEPRWRPTWSVSVWAVLMSVLFGAFLLAFTSLGDRMLGEFEISLGGGRDGQHGSNDIMFGEPFHEKVEGYLEVIREGHSPASFYGECAKGLKEPPHTILGGEGRRFEYKLTGSTAGGQSASVNIEITGADRTASPYVVDLEKQGNDWKICGVSTGEVQLDID